MPGLPVPKLRPGAKAKPRGGKDGYGGRAGGGTGHGSVESESWRTPRKDKIMRKVEYVTCSYSTTVTLDAGCSFGWVK